MSYKQLNFITQGTRKKKQTKLRVRKWKEITKVRVEIKDTQSRKIIERINKTQSWISEKIFKNDKCLALLKREESNK